MTFVMNRALCHSNVAQAMSFTPRKREKNCWGSLILVLCGKDFPIVLKAIFISFSLAFLVVHFTSCPVHLS